jgi:hypothetical protein
LRVIGRARRALPAITSAATATAAAATTTATATVAAVAATTATTVATTAAAAVVTTAATTTATTTAAAEATTTTATEAATTATAAAALLALLGLVDAQRATVERTSVHALDRLGGFLGSSHGHEREPAGAPGLAIRDQVDVADGSKFLERSTDAISICIERKISNVQTSVHRLLDLAQVANVPAQEGAMVLHAGFAKREGERCFKLPLSTGPKPKPTKVATRSYSWRFAIATWKVDVGSTGWIHKA